MRGTLILAASVMLASCDKAKQLDDTADVAETALSQARADASRIDDLTARLEEAEAKIKTLENENRLRQINQEKLFDNARNLAEYSSQTQARVSDIEGRLGM